MESWDQIRNGIFAGESGGDYNALYGYANRPGEAFGGINLTAMPVGEVIRFTDPSGQYAQHVKGQIGRVATPVGAYQVVGTTLRAAVEALGIDPNQPFDQATQDAIGQWIYQTQGTGAWEGYRGPRDTRPNALGGAPQPTQNALAKPEQPRWQYNVANNDPAAFQLPMNALAPVDFSQWMV